MCNDEACRLLTECTMCFRWAWRIGMTCDVASAVLVVEGDSALDELDAGRVRRASLSRVITITSGSRRESRQVASSV